MQFGFQTLLVQYDHTKKIFQYANTANVQLTEKNMYVGLKLEPVRLKSALTHDVTSFAYQPPFPPWF